MGRIILIGLSVFGFMVFMDSANGKEMEMVSRDDCHMSFIVPTGLEYVDVGSAITSGKDECYIPFLYTRKLRLKRTGPVPRMPEDWRALTDFALTVEAIPVADSLAQVELADGAAQNGLFRMVSKEHARLSGGDVYVITYLAIKPESTMSGYQKKQLVFVAGNGDRSTVFRLYYGDQTSKVGKDRERAFRHLFASFGFF